MSEEKHIINTTFYGNNDYFAELFDNSVINWTMFILYLVGLVSCGGLVMVSWYEKSGEATSDYRTVLDQLVSFILDHVVIIYLTTFGIYNLRIIVGPLPSILCLFASFCKIFLGCNVYMILLSISAIKFYLVKIRKSFPIMNDNIITFAIVGCITVINVMATLSKLHLDENESIIVCICKGQIQHMNTDSRTIPLIAIVGPICIFGHVVCTIPLKKVNANSVQLASGTKLGTVLLTSIVVSLLLVQWVTILILMKSNVDELSTSYGKMIYFSYTTLIPFTCLTTTFSVFYVTHKRLRFLLKRMFRCSNPIYPTHE